jgi:PAS domain S-box-containing protein
LTPHPVFVWDRDHLPRGADSGNGGDMMGKPANDAHGGRLVGPEQWIGRVGLAVAVGLAYFAVAQFSLALRADTGTAIFWPAAGIAVAALIAWGPTAHVPVSAGVVVATTVSNLLIGRTTWLAVVFGFVNVGQALLTAGLVERWFGRSPKLGDVSQVLAFLVAGTIGAAVGAMGATIAVALVQQTGSPLTVWRVWFASCLLGIVTVAPLLLGIAEAVRNSPSRRELVEGAVGVVMLAALSAFVIQLPEGPWSTALPVALVFPVLLWSAVRCRPVFSAAAGFVVALTIVWSLTFSVGHFGNASIALADRVLAAQTIVLTGAVLTLVLAALFAERRRNEAALKESERRFRLTADAAPVMVWISDIDKLCTWFNKPWLDFVGRTMEEELGNGWSENVHADDFDRCLKTYVDAFDTRQPFSMEYRLRRHDGEYRWVLDNGIPLWEPARGFAGYIGSCIDITERKQAEDHKSLLVAELDHRVKNTLACVAAIAEQTRAASRSMDEFLDVLKGRLQSLAKTHDLLSLSRWRGVDLAELVRGELAPCMRGGNTLVDGPSVDVIADSVQTVAIVLHELTTNAAKHGALSNGSGRISVRWHWQLNGGTRDGLVLEWRETGGPPVVTSAPPGYGISVIRELIPYELGGTVDYDLAADGARCKLEIPARWLRRRQPHASS